MSTAAFFFFSDYFKIVWIRAEHPAERDEKKSDFEADESFVYHLFQEMYVPFSIIYLLRCPDPDHFPPSLLFSPVTNTQILKETTVTSIYLHKKTQVRHDHGRRVLAEGRSCD